MRTLYRFKSNPKTIVEIEEEWVYIVWSESYEWGFGTRWIYRLNPENLIELTAEETAAIELKITEFKNRKKYAF